MIATRRHSILLNWTLCLAVLLSLQLCALRHGQSGGLALSGLDGAYCSGSQAGFAPFSVEPGEPSGEWQCPLCQSSASSDNGWPLDAWLRRAGASLSPDRRQARRARRRFALACPRAP